VVASGDIEMETFTVCSRSSLFVNMAMIAVCGVLPLIAMGNRGGSPILLLFGIAALLGLFAVPRSVHTIRVENNGTVHFERLLGTTGVNVRDISVLEGFRKNEYDGMVWKMRVRYRGCTVTAPFFDGAPAFISAVRALEPRVYVQGEWPTLDPWSQTA
jgi:hypothetical protein